MAVKRHRGLEPQRVSRGETAGKYADRRSGFEEFLPKLLGVLCIGVDFETVFTCVSGAGDDRFNSVNTAGREMVVRDLVEIRIGERLQDVDCFRTLDGDLAIVGARVR